VRVILRRKAARTARTARKRAEACARIEVVGRAESSGLRGYVVAGISRYRFDFPLANSRGAPRILTRSRHRSRAIRFEQSARVLWRVRWDRARDTDDSSVFTAGVIYRCFKARDAQYHVLPRRDSADAKVNSATFQRVRLFLGIGARRSKPSVSE